MNTLDPLLDPLRRDIRRVKRAVPLLPKWTTTKSWPYHGVAYAKASDYDLMGMREIEDDDFEREL